MKKKTLLRSRDRLHINVQIEERMN